MAVHPKVIRNDKEHAEALRRIDQLLDAEPDTPEGDELDLWVTLADAYETEHHAIPAPDPVSAIRFRMEQQGLRQADLVPIFGSASRVSEVLRGKRGLTVNMIRALHRALGIPLAALVGTDDQDARGTVDGIHADLLPVGEMAKRGWFAGLSGAALRAGEPGSTVDEWVAGMDRAVVVRARACWHERTHGVWDPHALVAWKLRALWSAEQEALPAQAPGMVDEQLVHDIVRLSFLDEGPRLAVEYLMKSGIHVILEPHLPGASFDGIASLTAAGAPVVGLTLRRDDIAAFWFGLCHELSHVALHADRMKEGGFVDDLDARAGDELEAEADSWACEVLIPGDVLRQAFAGRTPLTRDIQAIASRLRIHPAIVKGRLEREQPHATVSRRPAGSGKVRGLLQQHAPCV